MRRALALVAVALVAAGVAGCGSGHGKTDSQAARRAGRRARDLSRLAADVRTLRADAAPIATNTLMGTPRLRHATTRYVHDLEISSLDDRTRNRQIDFAVAAVAGSCGQCFQQLEAMRPIPALAGQ